MVAIARGYPWGLRRRRAAPKQLALQGAVHARHRSYVQDAAGAHVSRRVRRDVGQAAPHPHYDPQRGGGPDHLPPEKKNIRDLIIQNHGAVKQLATYRLRRSSPGRRAVDRKFKNVNGLRVRRVGDKVSIDGDRGMLKSSQTYPDLFCEAIASVALQLTSGNRVD